ncbi:MAG: ADP-ribose pyrophosphatase, partial [Acidobacteriales bacterium]|nr:ADP-ribose pyrophosphatase [Terriglobales bacterium]
NSLQIPRQSYTSRCFPFIIPRMAKQKESRRANPRTTGIELISSKKIYQGPAFSVFKDIVREGAHTGQRDVVRHTGSVVILVVDEPLTKRSDAQVLLIRQYRYAAGQYMWELPAGRIDAGENKLAAAKRELLEETGVIAKKWTRIFQFYASPGFLDETMDVFLARGLTLGKAQPEEDEQISLRFFPLPEALGMVASNKIRDAKTMTALLWMYMMVSNKK